MQMPSFSKEFWLVSGFIVVLFLVGLGLQLFVISFSRQVSNVYSPEFGYNPAVQLPSNGQFTVRGEDQIGSFIADTDTMWKTYFNLLPRELKVVWYEKPKLINKDGALPMGEKGSNLIDSHTKAQLVRDFGCFDDYLWMCDVYVYEMGVIESNDQWDGQPLYLITIPQPGMGVYVQNYFAVFYKERAKFVLLNEGDYEFLDGNTSQNYSVYDYTGVIRQFVLGSAFSRIVGGYDIYVPDKIQAGDYGVLKYSDFEYKERASKFRPWSSSKTIFNNFAGILDISTGETNPQLIASTKFSDPELGTVYFDRGAFAIDGKNKNRGLYELIPYFLVSPEDQEEKNMYPSRFFADINWNDGRDQASNYFVLGGKITVGGCQHGIVPFTNIVNNETWFNESQLKQVGVTKSKGEPIYEAIDGATNQYYKDLFAYGYDGSQLYNAQDYEQKSKELELIDEETKYKNFLAEHPVFFWKDMMGNWRVYHNVRYQSLAECGKPVIYLYPEKTTDVNVQVKPNGGFTETIPQYPSGGWDVKAEPSGVLRSYDDGQVYPYLFWEGHADGFGYPEQGFVFAQDEVESGMKDVLVKFGMNKQEISDFLEFWLPKMTTSPYVFVTFAKQSDFERAAPLKISPKPDSILRVFMYFETLEDKKVVETLVIKPFERKGFSVVEWGGVLTK